MGIIPIIIQVSSPLLIKEKYDMKLKPLFAALCGAALLATVATNASAAGIQVKSLRD